MLGEKSLTGWSSLFLPGEVGTVLTTPSQLSASHFKRSWGSSKRWAVFRSIDDLPACFCMGRYLCLEPILPVATSVAALWRSTCKPYGYRFTLFIFRHRVAKPYRITALYRLHEIPFGVLLYVHVHKISRGLPCRWESLCRKFTNEATIFVGGDLAESLECSASDPLGETVLCGSTPNFSRDFHDHGLLQLRPLTYAVERPSFLILNRLARMVHRQHI